ncbi:hypothetical protein [Brevibacillus sp. 179-C9.3 HS]|uniref:hypothetical protein n=1 Tax=unclassified Brevibacillus TaxID=2684853 RepID=UPI0039A08D8B
MKNQKQMSANEMLQDFVQEAIQIYDVESITNDFLTITDLPRFFNRDYIQSNFSLFITIDSEEESYESMDSKFVLFHEEKPVWSCDFRDLILDNGKMYGGWKESGLLALFQAIKTFE